MLKMADQGDYAKDGGPGVRNRKSKIEKTHPVSFANSEERWLF